MKKVIGLMMVCILACLSFSVSALAVDLQPLPCYDFARGVSFSMPAGWSRDKDSEYTEGNHSLMFAYTKDEDPSYVFMYLVSDVYAEMSNTEKAKCNYDRSKIDNTIVSAEELKDNFISGMKTNSQLTVRNDEVHTREINGYSYYVITAEESINGVTKNCAAFLRVYNGYMFQFLMTAPGLVSAEIVIYPIMNTAVFSGGPQTTTTGVYNGAYEYTPDNGGYEYTTNSLTFSNQNEDTDSVFEDGISRGARSALLCGGAVAVIGAIIANRKKKQA